MSSTVRTTDRPTTRERPRACPECGGDPEPDGINEVCGRCGLVLATDALDRSERQYYPGDGGPDPRHTSATNAARHDRGLGSEIGRTDGLPARLRERQRWVDSGDHVDRGRAYAYGEVHRLANALTLPDVARETACRTYAAAQDAGLLRGFSHESMATAAVVVAARVHGHALTFDAVGDVARVGRDRVVSAYDHAVRELGLAVPPVDPAGLVGGVCEALGLDAAVRTDAEGLVRGVDGADLAGRKPQGIAAAAVYLAAPGVTQVEAGEAAGVCAVTVRKVGRVLGGETDG